MALLKRQFNNAYRRVKKTAGKVKDKVIDKTSDALSFYPRYKANKAQRTANSDVQVLQMARRNPMRENHTDPVFRARAARPFVVDRLKGRK